jgi:hypothetical protein
MCFFCLKRLNQIRLQGAKRIDSLSSNPKATKSIIDSLQPRQ